MSAILYMFWSWLACDRLANVRTGGVDFTNRSFDQSTHVPDGWRYEAGIMPWHDCMSSVTGPAAWDALSCVLPLSPPCNPHAHLFDKCLLRHLGPPLCICGTLAKSVLLCIGWYPLQGSARQAALMYCYDV